MGIQERARVTFAVSATGTTVEVAAALAGKKVVGVALCLSAVGADASAKFQSDTTDITGILDIQWADGSARPFAMAADEGILVTAAGEALNLVITGTLTGWVTYFYAT